MPEMLMAPTMAVHPLNGYHETGFGHLDNSDTPFAIGRVLHILAPTEAALTLTSADELTVMSNVD